MISFCLRSLGVPNGDNEGSFSRQQFGGPSIVGGRSYKGRAPMASKVQLGHLSAAHPFID